MITPTDLEFCVDRLTYTQAKRIADIAVEIDDLSRELAGTSIAAQLRAHRDLLLDFSCASGRRV